MKNKKSIAMAMAAVSTMGAVAPVFAAEIVGTVVREMNLDLLRSESAEVRIKAEKDLEKTKEYLEKMYAEKDTNGNKVYKFTETDTVETISGVKKVIKTIEISRNDDVTNKEVDKFVFTASQLDPGFGQEVPVTTVVVDFGKDEVAYWGETSDEDRVVKGAKAELSRIIYALSKGSNKSTVIKTEDYENRFTSLDVYAGKIGKDQVNDAETVKLAQINIIGKVGAELEALNKELVFVDANNDFLGHWAEDTIVDSMIAGIVDNTAKFNPEQEITRAQFAKMVCEAKNIKPIKYNQDNKEKFDKFTDVSVTEWYAGYVAAIYETGLMKGDGNGTFRPEDKISRQEVAVVLATLENNGVSVEEVTTDVNGNRVHKDTKTNFVDDSKIDVWADESVEHLRNKGFAKGYAVSGGKFEYRPVNNMSRAEALTMITRVSK